MDFFVLEYTYMKTQLKDKKCVPCEDAKTKPLTPRETRELINEMPAWILAKNNKKITRAWLFEDFVMAMKFVNQVAKLAEKQGHHPDITIWYNKVTLDLSTHSIKGLTENDFIVAAKIDGLIS